MERGQGLALRALALRGLGRRWQLWRPLVGLREGPAAWGLALRGSGWPAGASAGASPGMTVRRGRRAA
eukprot:4531339-Lingulodinium_polyedra.AAC.1